MSQSAITTAFEDYLAQQLAAGAPVTLDQFVFANVPDLDPDAPIDRGETVPTDYVVYQQDVTLPGVINDNEVVYSVTMGTDVGDFDFNWIGLVNASTGLLGMVTHAPVQQKFKNADSQQGNTLTRSFLMEYDGAATATNITTPAETWQIDFTARLSGMDERQRLENTDVYGDGAFFGDGFLVSGNPTDGYQIAAGSGYVGGLRVQLDVAQPLNVSAKPIMVYVDACWKGTLTSVWAAQQVITLADTLADYTDPDGTAHYVFAVASIDADGATTDLRPVINLLSEYVTSVNDKKGDVELTAGDIPGVGKNLDDIDDAAETRVNIGLGNAAEKNVVKSTTDTTAGGVLTVGYQGLGGSAISVAADGIESLPIPTTSSIIRYSPNGSAFLAGISAFCYNNGDGSTDFSEILAYITGFGAPFVRNKDGIQYIYTDKNPPPATDLSAYMKTADANAKYVQGVQLGAKANGSGWNSTSQDWLAPAGCAMVGINGRDNDSSGDADIHYICYKPIQRNINGSWATVTG